MIKLVGKEPLFGVLYNFFNKFCDNFGWGSTFIPPVFIYDHLILYYLGNNFKNPVVKIFSFLGKKYFFNFKLWLPILGSVVYPDVTGPSDGVGVEVTLPVKIGRTIRYLWIVVY